MNWFLWVLALFVVIGIGTWLVSFVAEALRPKPKTPAKLRWAPDIPIQSVEIGGNKVRYIKTGKGPVLVLLHTLRTQLDLFENERSLLAAQLALLASHQQVLSDTVTLYKALGGGWPPVDVTAHAGN